MSMNFFSALINFRMPTIVSILTFISKITKTSKCFKQEKTIIFQYFTFYMSVEISHSAEVSMKKVLGPEIIKLLSCSTPMSTNLQLLIKAKIPTS